MPTKDAKTHITNLLNGAGLNMINIAVGVIIGLVLTPFVISSLGNRYYGINEIIATFVGCFSLLDFGIDSAVSRFFTAHYAKNEKTECVGIANTAFFIFLILACLGTVCIFLSAALIYFIYPNMEDRSLFLHVLLINGAAFGINFMAKVFYGVINGTMRQQITGLCYLIIRVLGAVLTFTVIYRGGQLYSISFVNLSIAALNLILMWFIAKSTFPEFIISRLLFRVDWVRKLFGFALATFIVFIGDTIATRGGIFVIGAMLSVETVAPFIAVSVKLCEQYASLMSTIGGSWLISWLTYLYVNNEKKLIDESLTLAYKICTYSASFMFFGIVIWSENFIIRWMGEGFLVAYWSLVITAAEHWIIFSHAPNTKFLFAIAKHKILAYVNLVGAFVQIILMVIFVKLGWGITGVALGFFFASVPVRGLIIPFFVARIRQINFFKYYLNITSYQLIAALAFVIPFLISQKLMSPNYKYLLLTGFLSAICYVPFILVFGFNKTEKEKIKKILLSALGKK
ncbi:MAG: hypothetical protein LBJ00_13330 [Planctomycetaceae bacterium]|jgi:O-antigen/teichoic acid export membrane protein|nr:hypothetical protein [Planctomycetaceae bacterium]